MSSPIIAAGPYQRFDKAKSVINAAVFFGQAAIANFVNPNWRLMTRNRIYNLGADAGLEMLQVWISVVDFRLLSSTRRFPGRMATFPARLAVASGRFSAP